MRRKFFKEIFDIGKLLLMAFLITFVVNNILIANAQVPTGSMEPTIEIGSRVIFNRLAYVGSNSPQRGDIVLFYPPDGAFGADEKKGLIISLCEMTNRFKAA